MYRSNLAIISTTLIAAAALLGGCALEQSGESGEPAAQLEQSGESGEPVAQEDELLELEAEADTQLLAALPAEEDRAKEEAPAAVPNCVWTSLNDSGYTDYLRVTNYCSYSLRIKVVLAFATDKSCLTFPAHTYRDYSWNYPGRFDKLVSC